MSTITDAVPHSAAPAARHGTRPFFWSIRRELWEHRAVIFVPLIAAGVALFGFLVTAHHIPRNAQQAIGALDPMKRQMVLIAPYYFASGAILLTAFIVAIFYCLGALVNERRDRSILFWKSLPVSDLMTVLAKASIPLLVLPAIAFVTVFATYVVMLGLSTLILSASGNAGLLLTHVPLVSMTAGLLYFVIVAALWHAPLYGYLLLVSAYSRRSTFLWAVLPPLGLMMLEQIALGTSFVFDLIRYRFVGYFDEAFVGMKTTVVAMKGHSQAVFGGIPVPDPARFVASPGLWLGLVAAAALLAAAVWLRRYREPI